MDLQDPYSSDYVGIWLDGKDYDDPWQYRFYRYSDEWNFNEVGAAQSNECAFPDPVDRLWLKF